MWPPQPAANFFSTPLSRSLTPRDIIHLSIALCTCAGLLVCALIAALFIAALWQLSADGLIVGLFVLALVLLIFSLLCLLNEIRLATRSLRAGFEYAEERSS